MKYYELVVHVPQNNLTTVLEVITGSAELKGLRQLTEGISRRQPPTVGPRRSRDANGTAATYIMDRVSKGPTTVKELRTLLMAKKFSENTVSARLSDLIKDKKITRDTDGKVQMRK